MLVLVLVLVLVLGGSGAWAFPRDRSEGASLRLCVDPDWMPYEWIDGEGQFRGIAADLLALISEYSGVVFELHRTADWPASLVAVREGRCDALAFLNQTEARSEWLTFTEPYFTDRNVFIARQDFGYVRDPAALEGVRLALPEGTSLEEYMRSHYPNLTYLSMHGEAEVLQAIEAGEADLTVRSLVMAAYVLRKEGLFRLKIAGELPYFQNALRVGVVHSHAHLVPALNSGIAQLSPSDVEAAINRHISISVYRGVDYGLLMQVSAFFLALMFLVLFWTRRLKRLNVLLRTRETELLASRSLLQQSLEEEHQTNLAQQQFMRMVAHEFRTLLSIIESSCDLMDELVATPHEAGVRMMSSVVERQRAASRYLTELVERALSADRLLNANWKRDAAWVDCAGLLAEVAGYARTLSHGRHEIRVRADKARLQGDRGLLQIMLANLVDNAIKFSSGGEVSLSVFGRQDEVVFEVRDSGAGISECDVQRIFGKYQRGARADGVPGLGLGLYLVRSIAELHDGRVDLHSSPGQGCRFVICIPVCVALEG